MESDDLKDFITPPDHLLFRAKKLFGTCGEIVDIAIAYIEAGGGGPAETHTHDHDHLFIVISGRACIRLGDSEIILNPNESYRVPGRMAHAVWNRTDKTTVMIGISVK